MKNIFTLLIVCLVSIQAMQAQKFGYVSSTEVLAEHPQIKTADQELLTYQNTLIEQGKQMVTSFESKYQAYVAEANQGTLSQIQMQEKEASLSQEQQKIQQFEIEVQQKIALKRETLYAPILEKVRIELENMGKEEGYTFIFDSSAGVLLHADDSEDLTAKLKSRIGI